MAVTFEKISPNLDLNHKVNLRKARGESLVNMAFGEARLPPFPALVDHLIAGARRNSYGSVLGDDQAREAVSRYFTRRRQPTSPDQVILAPGSKPLLMALNLVLPGDVLLPRPCWNTYAPQAHLAGKHAYGIPIPDDCGGVPEPTALRDSIRAARLLGHDPRIVVVTLPDNPTGTLAPPDTVREICAIAEEEDLFIVSDEIYRDLVHDTRAQILSPAEVVPHRVVVTSGLSKSLAIGGWRIGVARFPSSSAGMHVRDGVASAASEIWSTLARPMQSVAAYAFSEPPELRAHVAATARLHGELARAVHGIMVNAGATCRRPTGGFYVYPDFEPLRANLALHGVTDSDSLRDHLLEEYGIAVLAGHLLGDDSKTLRFKAATSMLYGENEEQQWAALNSPRPLTLPHIREYLTRIEEAIAKLCA